MELRRLCTCKCDRFAFIIRTMKTSRVLPCDADASTHHPKPSEARDQRPPALDSHTLLRGAREVEIRHGQERYRLRHTSTGKLILTK